jgi:hypothetical protein
MTALLLLVACASDADTDGDGLLDREERDLGTDPERADTDGDGYPDAAEIDAGSDPIDPESGIYAGGWPWNADKDALVDPGWETLAAVGGRLPRFAWEDQDHEAVDVYDFAGHGRPVVIDLSGLWCSWCHEVATWLEGEPSKFDEYPEYAAIPGMVEAGDVYWITALDAGYDPSIAANALDQAVWVTQHPNPRVPVLIDADHQLEPWMQALGYPSLVLVDEDLVVRTWNPDRYFDVFDALVAR